MNQTIFTALFQALRHFLLPRVIGMTLLPLLIFSALAALAGWLWWGPAVAAMQSWLQSWRLIDWMNSWLTLGEGHVAAWLAPVFVLSLSVPLAVLGILLAVSLVLTPRLVALVAERRFAWLAQRGPDSALAGLWWALKSGALAVLMLVLSLPFWLIPPLAAVLPPLIWGWLTYRVMSYDALAAHASAPEMHTLLKQHRWNLLLMGLITGVLGAAPGLVWLSGLLSVVLFFVLAPLAVWIYMAVFVLSSLWYAHYCLAALANLRGQTQPPARPEAGNAPWRPVSAHAVATPTAQRYAPSHF